MGQKVQKKRPVRALTAQASRLTIHKKLADYLSRWRIWSTWRADPPKTSMQEERGRECGPCALASQQSSRKWLWVKKKSPTKHHFWSLFPFTNPGSFGYLVFFTQEGPFFQRQRMTSKMTWMPSTRSCPMGWSRPIAAVGLTGNSWESTNQHLPLVGHKRIFAMAKWQWVKTKGTFPGMVTTPL